ncbi:MAG: alpha/beta hydrolase [Leptolyngbyaceae cyanobacterium CRU_2_3]|nr:alpha/beta hydrolase [Leptolyngbyaceae cyanobacterium CRU_2_3]
MLSFHPPGFEQRIFKTSLGIMVYYTSVDCQGPSDLHETDITEQDLPPLVFLHSLGGGSSAYEWSKVYPALAATYRIIAPDLIGWGQSPHPAKDYQIEDYFILLAELLEQLSPPVPVVASSLTAGLTIRLAIRRPDLFQKLFLVSPAGYADFGADYGSGMAAQIVRIPGLDRLLYTLAAANEFAVRTFLEEVLFAERSRLTQETVNAYLASAQQLNAEYAALSSLRGDLCFDLALYFDQLTTATFIVWGEKSRFGGVDIGKRLARLNPNAVKAFWAIANTGVLPHLETPEIVIGLLHKALEMEMDGSQAINLDCNL